MSPFGIGKTAPTPPARPVGADKSAARAPAPLPAPGAASAGVRVDLASSAADHAAPVDQDRVAEIRTALRDGTYPIVPARIADALIAAQLTLRGQA